MRDKKKFPRRKPEKSDLTLWKPKTKLGKMVLNGEIKTMHEALASRLPIKESEIVDILLPNLEDEVIDINMVQRMTDSGRRVKFAITCVVGNNDGYVGIGREKGKEVGPTIKKAIANAKLNILEIKRGCGSWECGCGKPHSLPFAISGKIGSVEVEFVPAPQGISLAVGDVAKSIMKLAGIKDTWGFVRGHTKTTVNYALATFDALKKNTTMKITQSQTERLHIFAGAVGIVPSSALVPADSVPENPKEMSNEKLATEDGKKEEDEPLPIPTEPAIDQIKAPEKVVKALVKLSREAN